MPTRMQERLRMEEIHEDDLIGEILYVAPGEDCHLCREGNGECIWKELERELIPAGRNEFDNHWPDELNQQDANKKARFTMYRHYVSIIEGYCGKGKRIRLPCCVEIKIKLSFPDVDANYVGYKAGVNN
jgi:hypothetical protein